MIDRDKAGAVLSDHGPRAARFAGVGVICMLIDVSVYAVAVFFGLAAAFSNVIAFLVANLASYGLNGRLTFADRGDVARASLAGYGRFLAAHLVGLAASTTTIILLVGIVGPYWAKLVSIGVAAVFNYLLSALVVFRKK